MSGLIKYIEQISHRHHPAEVFRDFCRMSVCALSLQQMEDEYMTIISRYNKDEVRLFPKMFAQLVSEMYPHKDALGDTYMDIAGRWKSKHLGQYFTPIPVCEMMANIANPGNEYGNVLNDCACGSGRTLLAAAKLMTPLQKMTSRFYAEDLDSICVDMCAINFTLNGMLGRVSHCNTLTLDYFGGYHISMHEKGVPFITPFTPEYLAELNTKPERNDSKPKPDQLSLFEPSVGYSLNPCMF